MDYFAGNDAAEREFRRIHSITPRRHAIVQGMKQHKNAYLFGDDGVPTPAEVEAADQCSICMEKFEFDRGYDRVDQHDAVKLPCGHIVGRSCFLEWMRISDPPANSRCHMCRATAIEPIMDRGISELAIHRSSVDQRMWQHEIEVVSPNVVLATGSIATTTNGRSLEVDISSEDDEEWADGAEELWVTLCEKVIGHLEKYDFEMLPYYYHLIAAPLAVYVTDCVTLRAFNRDRLSLEDDTSHPIRYLRRAFPQAYLALETYLDGDDPNVPSAKRPWRQRRHPWVETTARTYDRLASYHRRIDAVKRKLIDSLGATARLLES